MACKKPWPGPGTGEAQCDGFTLVQDFKALSIACQTDEKDVPEKPGDKKKTHEKSVQTEDVEAQKDHKARPAKEPNSSSTPPPSAEQEKKTPKPERSTWTNWYVVWKTPGSNTDMQGIHHGPKAWKFIVKNLHDGRYKTGRDHLRRFDSYEEALEGYKKEHIKHQSIWPCPEYWHQ